MFRTAKSLSKSQEASFLSLVMLPFLKPVRASVLSLLRDAGLLEPASPAPFPHEEVKP